ncbi:CbiX/SirB N-terminal domain-containing protein [Pontibaca methylaminivorans]|uniref:CbiX/SirB N-terminal domain-containing protein n=1 Tax=Pontibaca methylaminivorans TaxID=515897 RepID=UPI002FDB4B0B
MVLVSHGQPSDPAPAERELAALAAEVAALLPGHRVLSATLAAPGALEVVLESCAGAPLVYPVFMTDGWFTQARLPERIGTRMAHILAPLGREAALPRLARDHLAGVLAAEGWEAAETTLLIAAHGSGRSRNSAEATHAFAEALGQLAGFRDIRAGFIEEPPYIGDLAFEVPAQSICLPFFAASGEHVTDDVPEALDLAGFQGPRLAPLGTLSGIAALIAERLGAEISERSTT